MSGEWRVHMKWLRRRRPIFHRVVDRFDQGTVYRFWIAWLFVKVMVKS